MYNAFPSGHVYITTLIALFWSRWFPKWRWALSVTAVIVILATLFTKQHYLPDPIGGLALAWFGYRTGIRFSREWNVQRLKVWVGLARLVPPNPRLAWESLRPRASR